jgi:hypothetical protein
MDDVDTFPERFWITFSGLQWRHAMFPEEADRAVGLVGYLNRLRTHEFTMPAVICVLIGALQALRARPALGALICGAGLVALAAVLNYHPPDWHIFYLPTYALVALMAGAGAGWLIHWAVAPAARPAVPGLALAAGVVVTLLLAAMLVGPLLASRWQALQSRTLHFVEETYPYPKDDLAAPRHVAAQRLAHIPDDAALVMGWRALYTTYYLAQVEGVKPDLVIKEAVPQGASEELAPSLVDWITDEVAAGRPVYVDELYAPLLDHVRGTPAPGTGLYRLTPRLTTP